MAEVVVHVHVELEDAGALGSDAPNGSATQAHAGAYRGATARVLPFALAPRAPRRTPERPEDMAESMMPRPCTRSNAW